MRLIIEILIEKLHRHIFDSYYRQDYEIGFKAWCIIRFYDLAVFLFPNWRFELTSYFKKAQRYERYCKTDLTK